jgi:hypothetical protein
MPEATVIRRRYYVIGKTTVSVTETDNGNNVSDKFVCDARDWKTADTIAEALNLKESNRQTSDDD